jgi:hypothetical protein
MQDQRRRIIGLMEGILTPEQKLEALATGKLEAYSLKTSSEKQQTAIRALALDYGFVNLRGFASWMKAVGLDYYDLIKIASPE